MLRFHALRRVRSSADTRRLEEVARFHHHEFPSGTRFMDAIRDRLMQPLKLPYVATLVTAERADGTVLGFAFYDHFPDLSLSYLEYIVTAPDARSQGVGGALYEAMRENLVCDGSEGLLFEVNPDDDTVTPEQAKANGATLKFYERYDARPLEGVRFDYPPFGPLARLMVVHDDLGTGRKLDQKDMRAFFRKLYDVKYHAPKADPHVKRIVASIPKRIKKRPLRYLKPTALRPEPKPGEHIARIEAIVSPEHKRHKIPERDYLERPLRVARLLDALKEMPHIPQRAPKAFPDSHLLAVHDKKMVGYLRDASATLRKGDRIYPTVFPIRRRTDPPGAHPTHAGYFSLDSFTPITSEAYPAARAAVDVALTAAERLRTGEANGPMYALTRPPGHHAERDLFGGFCYFNSAAVAAEYLSKNGRVAILDVDYHHGNGQQQIFYDREDVLTVSIHGDPRTAYPYFTGFEEETGTGAGEGANLNMILPDGTGDDAWMTALGKAIARIREHEPEYVVVALGLDASRDDPSGTFRLSRKGFERMGREIAKLDAPMMLTQEGGYNLKLLPGSLTSFLKGLEAPPIP